MSGAQIGSAVGFVAGFFLPGGPMVWSAIGGAIGGWISPTQVNGPRIGDGQSQSAAEGMPIPWILGTGPSPIQGQIVQKSPRREVKKTDDGKGSGTEVNTYEAHQDFCILFCESSEHRGSLMKGVLFCLVDGKIVYDTRPEANFAAENAKFLQHHTFYNGNESQMPDPTMEALVGVDFAMYYRGVFTMVGRDINLSAYGDRIPVYQVVMVGEGDSVTEVVTELAVPGYGRFQNAPYPLADPESLYLYKYHWTDETGAGHDSPVLESIQECNEHFLANVGVPAPNKYVGYSANTTGTAGPYTTGSGVTTSLVAEQQDVTNIASLVLLYQWFMPSDWNDTAADSSCALSTAGTWRGLNNGSIVKRVEGFQTELLTFQNCGDDTYSVGYYPYCIQVLPKRAPPSESPVGDPCALGVPVKLPGSPGFTVDCAGVVRPEPIVQPVTGDFRVLQVEEFETVDGNDFYIKKTRGPVLLIPSADNTEAFWTAAYQESLARGESPPGWTYPADYPATVLSGIYELTYETTTLSTETLGLDTAITRICERGGLSADDIDVADMDQQVMGFGILQPYTATEALSPLLQAFLAYGSEYDAKLHFHNHGEDIEIVIDPNDFIEGSDETDEATRDQQIEYPRQLSVVAIDATQNYTARPQVARRTSPDIRAIGEQAIEVAVVLPVDYHAQLSDIGLKVLWARAQGPRKFTLPFAQSSTYLKLVPGMPFALDGKRWMLDKQRIGSGEMEIEAVFDRQSAYTSDVQPTPALPPTPPPSSIGGVTLFEAMNLPRLRSIDNVPGMYIAVAGLLASWPGCFLQMSTDDGASWTVAIGSMTQASTLGYLTAPIGALPTDTLSVSVHGGVLNSITEATLATGGNPSAVVTAGVAEILQFQNADEVEPDKYNLTNLPRGRLSTVAAPHTTGDRFVLLTDVYFLPLDITLAGQQILFRPVTFGTAPDSNAIYPVTFLPQFTGPQVVEAYVNDVGEEYTNESGSTYYRIVS